MTQPLRKDGWTEDGVLIVKRGTQIRRRARAIVEQREQHEREQKKLSDLAFVFLNATEGNISEAEHLLDDLIELVFEGGVLSTWRYRILLAAVREGL